MALTRDVAGTITRSDGKPWRGAVVRSQLVAVFATEDDTHPADPQEWEVDSAGDFTMQLAVPETGTAQYRFTLPSNEVIAAYLDYDDGSDIDFEILVAGGGGAPIDIDTTLMLINARLAPAFTVLTDGATVTWNFANYPLRNAKLTLGGNRTLAITNISNGASGVLIVIQDGTGGRTLALPAGSKVIDGGAGVVTLSSAGNKIDVLSFIYDGTTFYWTYGTNFTGA
jgi:hypothetical protein